MDNETYVIVSNHQSLVDILVAFTLFKHFKWVSKSGTVPHTADWLEHEPEPLRQTTSGPRFQHQADVSGLHEQHLNEGSSIYLFPEGTRSETGQMRAFKEGAFVLAKRLHKPILPLVINGSRNAVPKNSFNFHGNTHVEVEVLDPIFPESFADETPRELADRVHT